MDHVQLGPVHPDGATATRAARMESYVPAVVGRTYFGYAFIARPPSRAARAGLFFDGRQRRGDALQGLLFGSHAQYHLDDGHEDHEPCADEVGVEQGDAAARRLGGTDQLPKIIGPEIPPIAVATA